MQKNLKLFELE